MVHLKQKNREVELFLNSVARPHPLIFHQEDIADNFADKQIRNGCLALCGDSKGEANR